MKRMQLFEFEDFPWFPSVLRQGLTRYLRMMHRLLKTDTLLAPLLAKAMHATQTTRIVDLCSGAGGPLPDTVRTLRQEHGLNAEAVLTDLYPNTAAAAAINAENVSWLRYETQSVDAGNVPAELSGMRTMVCSFHHMPLPIAQKILRHAFETRQPICIFEISDNTTPKYLWWSAIPVSIVLVLLLTPLIRPLTFKQLLFTYVIPVLPVIIAWDGAASNARTYSEDDLRIILRDFSSPEYEWKIETLRKPGYPSGLLTLLGLPTKNN